MTNFDDLIAEYGGSIAVVTESGTSYIIDLLGKCVLRVPDTENVENTSYRMRKDNEWLPLHGLLDLRVGSPAKFLLSQVSDDSGVVTLRVTSNVVSIQKAEF